MKRLKEKIKVLYVGDTQVNTTTSSKGMDTWTFSFYSDSARYLRNALNASDDIEQRRFSGAARTMNPCDFTRL